MKLTDSQYVVLILWHLRCLRRIDHCWQREWDHGLMKRGKKDGNRVTGRWKTFDSLMRLGLLEVPIPEDSYYPDKAKAVLTAKGLEIVNAAPRSAIVKLPPVAREVFDAMRHVAERKAMAQSSGEERLGSLPKPGTSR